MAKNYNTAYNCKKSIIRWNNLRWETDKVIAQISPKNAFVISKAQLDAVDDIDQYEDMRGYLGFHNNGGLQLIVLSEDRDMDIYLSPKTTEDASLYVAPYKRIPGIDQIIAAMKPEYAERVNRWRKDYAKYITTINSTTAPKSRSNGLVKVFDIPGPDLYNAFQQYPFVIAFLALKEGMTPAAADLIIMGVDDPEATEHGKRKKRIATATGLALSSSDEDSGDGEDFTTPRPPFNDDDGYGLL
jgi:hypothetical protein